MQPPACHGLVYNRKPPVLSLIYRGTHTHTHKTTHCRFLSVSSSFSVFPCWCLLFVVADETVCDLTLFIGALLFVLTSQHVLTAIFPSVFARISSPPIKNFIVQFVCQVSASPPTDFGCTPSDVVTSSPTISTDSPTFSPAPSTALVPITILIRTDRFPEETGWRLQTTDGEILREVPTGSYSASSTNFVETLTVRSEAEYVLVLIDTMADGLCCVFGRGEAIVYLDDKVNDSKVLAYNVGAISRGTRSFSRFFVSDTAVIDSMPIRPTSSAEGDYPVTITVQTDDDERWPQDINWRLERIDVPSPILVLTAPPKTYFLRDVTVNKVAYVLEGGLYRLDFRDENQDGFRGMYEIHTGTTNPTDNQTLVVLGDGQNFFEQERRKFIVRPASFSPEFDPRQLSLEIQFDNSPHELQWFMTMEYERPNGQQHREVVDFGPPDDVYEDNLANQNVVRQIEFSRIPGSVVATIGLTWSDSGRDGICCGFGNGYLRVWLGPVGSGQLMVSSTVKWRN